MATGTRLNMPAGIDANATNLTVFAERGLDVAPFYAAFESGEIVKVTTGGPDTDAWVVERGALSTTRAAHQNGERLRIVIAHEAAVLVAAGSGTSLPGVTDDRANGILLSGALTAFLLSGGPVPAALRGDTPDPSYDPTATYGVGDIATGASYYSDALVHFETWTPTLSGTVNLGAPAKNAAFVEIDLFVFAGHVIGTDVPSLDGSGTHGASLADAFWFLRGSDDVYSGASFDVVAGQTYTLALSANVAGFGDPTAAIGTTLSLREWALATQLFGGQARIVNGAQASGFAAVAGGYGSRALGAESAAFGSFAVASADQAQAEGLDTTASGIAAHAEGWNTNATADNAHAEGDTTRASGASSHAEGQLTMVSGFAAHGEGTDGLVSGDRAHGEGHDNTASGTNAHAQGMHGFATALAAHSEGSGARADRPGEHAHASGWLATQGDAQYARNVLQLRTTDATPTALLIGGAVGVAGITPTALVLPSNQTWQVLIQASASRQDTPGTVKGWLLKGLVTTVGGTARLVGSPTSENWADAGASTWTAALGVDTGTGAIIITATGEAGKTINWHATLHAACVGV